jgi:Spy/CpxP family protein refolding chaperone
MSLCKTVAIGVAAITVLWSGAAFAQGAGPGRHGMGGLGALAPLLRVVDLTDAQKTQVHTIVQSYRSQLQTDRAALGAAQRQFGNTLFGTPLATSETLAPLGQAVAQARTTLAQHQQDMTLAMLGVLRPDQLAKVASTHQQLGGLRSQMRALLTPPQP